MVRLMNQASDPARFGATGEDGDATSGHAVLGDNPGRRRAMPGFLDIGEVAALFGRARRTIRWWIATGRLPAIRIGRTPFVPEAAISALLGTARISDPDGPEE